MAYDYYQRPYDRPFNFNQQMQNPMQLQSPVNQLIWVQGESGAKAYGIPANSTVILMDSEANKFYIKTTDMAGMPSMKSYEYAEAAPQVAIEHKADYVTREEFNALVNKIEFLNKSAMAAEEDK
jgi:hypothetical protein